jgi:periplasmic protein TonB
VVLLAVVVLHVLVLLLFSLQRPGAAVALPVVSVQLLSGDHSAPDVPAPQVAVELVPQTLPILVLPHVETLPEPVADPSPAETQLAAAPVSPGTSGDIPLQVMRVDYIRQPYAPYPPKAKKRRETGMVLLVVLVGVDGLAREARVYRSSGFVELDKAAVTAVHNALFRPLSENGVPRAIRVIVPINFSLSGQPGG